MAGGCTWSRRVSARTRTLRTLVRDTQRALQDVCDIIHFDPDIAIAVQDIGSLSSRATAIVVLGTSAAARARLLHSLLGRRLLPDPAPKGCRWLRIQYGVTTQVHLTLGNSEFELVEELHCNKRPWETLPLEDLIRQDQTDLATMLEVEINNSFLKDGLRIVVPPDIDCDSEATDHLTLKKMHEEFYNKRDMILRNFNPIYMCAIDKIGKNVFCGNVCNPRMVCSRSDEDFWDTFNLYQMAKVGDSDSVDSSSVQCVQDKVWTRSSDTSVFSAENCLDLHQIKEINPNAQVLFVLFSDSVDVENNIAESAGGEATESTEERVYRSEELPESDQALKEQHSPESPEKTKLDNIRLHEEQIAFMNDLLDQWELMCTPSSKLLTRSQWMILDDKELSIDKAAFTTESKDRLVRSRTVLLNNVVKFATDCMQSYLLEYSSRLSEIHVKLLQQFILASFDMARELQVVPKKIRYVATHEQQLYETINEKFSQGEKKQELVKIMQEVLQEIRTEIQNMDWSVDDLPCHQESRFVVSNSTFYSSTPAVPLSELPSEGEEAVTYDTYSFDDYDIIHSQDDYSVDAYGNRPKEEDALSLPSAVDNIKVENESEMFSLSSAGWSTITCSDVTLASGTTCTNTANISLKQASLDVQQTVLSKLSRKISLKLVKFVDCLKDTYFGTLQRCVESLEASCRAELGGRPASEAVRQLLSVAGHVDLQPCATFSVLRSVLDSLRRLLARFQLSGDAGEACCALSPVWRRRVALHTARSLTAQRLARLISAQIVERLRCAHERYQWALGALQAALAARLLRTEDVKLAVRKKYAPSFARLCLESTSMCDLLMYGTPELGREIGRGQYGVVYAARGSWGGHSPVAVKSVLPADDRHYRDLAMEFFYTRSIPPHPRIVRLFGSVVQRAGAGPGVLLVSERKCRDLHAALRAGLPFAARMAVSCDIVEGIRYLHSLGLVHRDIKMKNVLLDGEGRAALSDLGFCAAEALMSGSVVGTPVHMAPELLAGDYDATVDVYAFGILFWYVCAGNVKLPAAFEMFQNKEQLWSKVKRGLRPERLPHFSDECWRVMESCWASEPSQRALLGDVQPTLLAILQDALQHDSPAPATRDQFSDDDSLDMTGIDRRCL